MLIELQSHSTVSDGQLAPAEVVEEAAKAGVTTLALTDHDAVAGVPEAAEAAEQLGVELVPAIEMSCVHEYAEDLHVCGYWVDLGKIAPACERAQHERVTRAGEIVEKLRRRGLRPAPRGRGPRGRRRRSRSAVPTSPAPPAPPATSAPSSRSTWCPAPRPSCRAAGRPPSRRSRLIREAGGVAVVAHPYWDISEPGRGRRPDPLPRSADGVETFYPTHTKEQTEHLLELCDELDLVPTASSDYHGPTHKTFAKFGAYDTYGLGEPQVPAKP